MNENILFKGTGKSLTARLIAGVFLASVAIENLAILLFVIFFCIREEEISDIFPMIFEHNGEKLVFFILSVIAIVILLCTAKKTELTVSDKRVYGLTGKGAKLNIPISAIQKATCDAEGTVNVVTNNGTSSFEGIKDGDKACAAINASCKVTATRYQRLLNLLNEGVINQKDFDGAINRLYN